MKLNDSLKALGAEYAGTYASLAAKIAGHAAQAAAKAGAAKVAKGNVWADFKSALELAQEAGHTATALRVGLEIACIEADIPAGTFRSYVATVGDLYADIVAEKLTMEQATGLSIADARKRYKVETPADAMRAKLMEAVKTWDADQLAVLLSICDDINGEKGGEGEGEEEQEEGEQELLTGTNG